VSRKDVSTLNWKDIERNAPSRRCLLECPDIELLDDPGAYIVLEPKSHPANPVVDSTSVSNVQAYPASVIRADGIFYAAVGSWPRTVGFRSTDGVTWTETNGDLIPLGDSGAFDEYKATARVFRYDPKTGRFHIWYKGIDIDGTRKYGHATSDRPLQGYKKTGPVLSPQQPTDFRRVSEVKHISVNDIIFNDGKMMCFGSGSEAETGTSFVWKGTGRPGTRIRPETVLFTEEDHALTVQSTTTPIDPPTVGAPHVITVGGKYLLAYSSLAVVDDVEFAAAQGKIYAAVGDSPEDIRPTNDLLLDIGDCNTWEELRVYNPRWLKRQDGSYLRPSTVDGRVRLYYSGHDCGSSKFFGNRGVTGLTEFDPINLEEFVGRATQ
jgi:hypothetical protein